MPDYTPSDAAVEAAAQCLYKTTLHADDALLEALTAAVPLELQRERERWEAERDSRLGGITSAGLDMYESRLDKLGIPREEYSAQGGGMCEFTFWGRIDRLLTLAAALPTEEGSDQC